MTFNIPQLIEWNDYYRCPEQKVRLGVKLFNPSIFVINREALSHDFYYFSDEFSVIFHPLLVPINSVRKEVYMLVEGPHENPLGERIPILSTWQHLKVLQEDVAKSGIQHNFAYYNNEWWEAKFEYDYSCTNIDNCAYANSYWCRCNKMAGHLYYNMCNYHHHEDGHEHCYRPRSYGSYTIFDDTKQTDFYKLVKECYPYDLGVVADWLEDRGDPFADYIRRSDYKCNVLKQRKTPEISHMCESIKLIENDRAAKLLLLSEGIRR